jgi:hypothetical protein
MSWPSWCTRLALASCVGFVQAASTVQDGRFYVDGKPFFPFGPYVHSLSESDWQYGNRAGWTAVLTYTNGCLHTPFNLTDEALANTTRFLDAASAHGIMVILSIKDFYPPHDEALWRTTVTSFKDHRALLGWYIADEVKTVDLARVAQRAADVRALDPHHVTYTLLDNGLMESVAKHPARYRNLSLALGCDPYPWHNASTTHALGTEVYRLRNMTSAYGGDDGRAILTVSQAFDTSQFCPAPPKPPTSACGASEPPYAVKRAMLFLEPVLGSARGVLWYSYYCQFGYPSQAPAPPTTVERRLNELASIGEEVRRCLPALLGQRLDELLHIEARGEYTFAGLFQNGHAHSAEPRVQPGNATLIIVNGHEKADTIHGVVAARGSAPPYEFSRSLAPWDVAILSIPMALADGDSSRAA